MKRLCFCVVALFATSLWAQGNQPVVAVNAGKVEGNAYRSEYFRFTFAFPPTMKLTPESQQSFQAQFNRGMELTKQAHTADEIKEMKEVAASMIALLAAERKAPGTNRWANVQVLALNMTQYDVREVPAAEMPDFLEAMAESMLEDMRKIPTFRSLKPNAVQPYNGQQFAESRYAFVQMVEGKQVEVISGRFITFARGHLLIWQFTAGSEKALGEAMQCVSQIRFDGAAQ